MSGQTWDQWIQVWTSDGGFLCVALDEEPRIDAAVQRWVDMERDTVLSMSGLNGDVRYLASQIVGWIASTPQTRALDCLQIARDRDETRANRTAAGLPFQDDDDAS